MFSSYTKSPTFHYLQGRKTRQWNKSTEIHLEIQKRILSWRWQIQTERFITNQVGDKHPSKLYKSFVAKICSLWTLNNIEYRRWLIIISCKHTSSVEFGEAVQIYKVRTISEPCTKYKFVKHQNFLIVEKKNFVEYIEMVLMHHHLYGTNNRPKLNSKKGHITPQV